MSEENINPWNFHTCDLCHYMTKSVSVMHKHLDRHIIFGSNLPRFYCKLNTLEVYKCGFCDFETDFKVSLSEHILLIHNGREVDGMLPRISECYNCENCCFNTYSLLVITKHVSTCIQSKVLDVSFENLECEHCSYKCKSESLMNTHIHLEHSDGPCKCEKCLYKAKFVANMEEHILLKRANPEELDWLHCEKCFFICKLRKNLNHHMALEHRLKYGDLFNCKQCSHECKWISSLKRHVRLKYCDYAVDVKVKKGMRSKCKKCSYATKSKPHLKRHIISKHVTPEEINSHECVTCSFKTKTKSHLKTHVLRTQKSLQKLNWFQCDKCPYKSKLKICMRNHVLNMHTRPKEICTLYECAICLFKAKTRDELKQHVLRNHII